MSYKRLIGYLSTMLFCIVFATIYEMFSHSVYSLYMIYLFVIPFALGVIPEIILLAIPRLRNNSAWSKTLQSLAIVTLIFGSSLAGVFEIYGTTSEYPTYYFVAGAGMLLASFVLWCIKRTVATTPVTAVNQ